MVKMSGKLSLFCGLLALLVVVEGLLRTSTIIHRPRTSQTTVMLAAPVEFNWKAMKKSSEEKFTKCLENMQQQFNTVRAGGAQPSLLDRVMVEYYGQTFPTSQYGSLNTSKVIYNKDSFYSILR